MALVTGGTGVLGHAVVPRLRADGHEVAVLARQPAAELPEGARRCVGDLARCQGLEAAVRGVDVIVHLASSPLRAARVDVAGTSALTDAIKRCGGSPHLVYVSIVGVDRIPWPYYKRKRQAEALVAGSGLPFTIQRVTQFHDLVLLAMACAARMPAVVLPSGTSCQPIDVADVADRLADIVRSAPLHGYADDLGGPQVLEAADLAGQVQAVLGKRQRVWGVRIPGRIGAGFRAGYHLAQSTSRGTRTWAEYLERRCRMDGGGILRLPYTGKPVRRQIR